MEVIVNKKFGGASLSEKAMEVLLSLPEFNNLNDEERFELQYLSSNSLRTNKTIIDLIKSMGDESNGVSAKLVIANIPDGVEWAIYDYDGMETIERPRVIYA